MGRTSSVAIEAWVDDKASQPMREIGEATESTGEKVVQLNAAAELASKAWGVISSAVGGAIGFLTGAAKAAMEAEKAQRDLATSLKTHGANVDELLPKLNEQASAIQRVTGISGDNVTALQAQLAALGVLPDNIEAATYASIGWAKTTGKDMQSAAVDVTKALNGKYSALAKLGIKVTDSDAALRKMAEGYSLAIAEGQSLEGQLTGLTENYGDLEEAIGGAVSESEGAREITSALSGTVVQLQQVFASPEGRSAVDTFFRALAAGAGMAINAGLGALAFWENEVIPRVNNARMFFGEDVIAEAIDPDAEKAKGKVRELAENLANILDGIGKGKPIALPPIEAPALPAIVQQRGESDKFAAEAAKAAAAEEKAIEAALERGQRKADQLEAQAKAAADKRAQAEVQRATEILALTEQVERGKAEIAERNLQRQIEQDERARTVMAERAAAIATMFENVGSSIASTWERNFDRVGEVVDGVMVTRSEAFANFMEDIGKQIASFLASRLVLMFLKFLGGALSGGALGGLVEFLGFSKGGPVKAMASGGMVTGGVPGKDSVLINAMPGEYVLPVPVVDAIRRGVAPPTSAASPVPAYAHGGAVVPSAGGAVGGQAGPSIVVQVVSQTLERQTEAAFEAMVERQIAPAFQRAIDRGVITLTPSWGTG